MTPFPGIPWGFPGRSSVPHGIKRGGGLHGTELGKSGGTHGGGIGGTQRDGPGVSGFFIRRLYMGCVAPDVEVAEVVQRTHRPLQPWRSLCKFAIDGEHSILALYHPWWIVKVGVHTASDRDWSFLPKETMAEDGVHGV